MKAVPARVLALGLAVLVCMGALFLLESRPDRAAAESLQVTTETERNAGGEIQLRVSWHWEPPTGKRRGDREEVLAVSFDTSALVWLSEQAPSGIGARGDVLKKLERSVGPDGARRLFVIPEGEDGDVTLRFRPKYPDGDPVGEPFRVYVAFDHPTANVWMTETALPGGSPMTADKQDF